MSERIEGLTRVGFVATDPLRVLGLQTLLGKLEIEVVPLSVPRALDTEGVTVVLIDSEATSHLIELLAMFRQKRGGLRLIVLGSETGHDHIQKVIAAGAKGYLPHTVSEEELWMALTVVQDGSAWAPRKVMANLVESARERSAVNLGPRARFTPRERQVLRLLGAGKPNRQIATELGVNEAAVKAHIGRLMRKFGVTNRTALTLQIPTLDADPDV